MYGFTMTYSWTIVSLLVFFFLLDNFFFFCLNPYSFLKREYLTNKMIVYVIAKIDPVLVYIHVLEVFKCSKERKVFKKFYDIQQSKENWKKNKAITMMRGKSPRSDVEMKKKTQFRGRHLGFLSAFLNHFWPNLVHTHKIHFWISFVLCVVFKCQYF